MLVKVWDYERVQVQHTITAHRSEVCIVKFLKPFPLLLTADQSGILYIWLTKPKIAEAQLILTWRNLKNIKEQPPITAVDSYYHREKDQAVSDAKFMLFIGDEAGKVTVQDLSAILKKIDDLQELDVTDPKKSGLKRNPYRSIPIQYDKKDNDIKTGADEGIFKGEPLIDESEIR